MQSAKASESEALRQLDFFKFGHMRAGREGVLDHCFETYLEEVEPLGVSYEDWVRSAAYDPAAIKQAFRAQRWGGLLRTRRHRQPQPFLHSKYCLRCLATSPGFGLPKMNFS